MRLTPAEHALLVLIRRARSLHWREAAGDIRSDAHNAAQRALTAAIAETPRRFPNGAHVSRPTYTSQTYRLRILRNMLTVLELELPKVHEAIDLHAPDGLGAGGGGDRRAKGDHSDRTCSSVVGFDDDGGMGGHLADLDDAITAALDTMRFAYQTATKISSVLAERAHEAPVGQGWCSAHCGHWCPGTVSVPSRGVSEDRLRSGLCDACRKWAERNGHPDIADVRRGRRGSRGKCGCDDCKHIDTVTFEPKIVA